jgi:hypothetical protein
MAPKLKKANATIAE